MPEHLTLPDWLLPARCDWRNVAKSGYPPLWCCLWCGCMAKENICPFTAPVGPETKTKDA